MQKQKHELFKYTESKACMYVYRRVQAQESAVRWEEEQQKKQI